MMTDGDRAWLALALYVVAYDTWALTQPNHDTLSCSFNRALQHPIRRWPTLVLWASLTVHLLDLVPSRLNPLKGTNCGCERHT